MNARFMPESQEPADRAGIDPPRMVPVVAANGWLSAGPWDARRAVLREPGLGARIG